MQRFTQWYSTGRDVIRTPLERSTAPRVTLQELEEQCGLPIGSAMTKLAALRVKVEGDWAGRPSVSLADAAKVHTTVVGELEADSQKWASYQQYLADREERREQAAREAAAQARAQATRDRLFGDPERESRASHAARVAREEFEAANPVVGFDEFRVGGAGE